MTAWSWVDRVFSSRPTTDVALPERKEPAQAGLTPARGPLDEVGQQSEHIRERIGSLSERLDELKTLAGDFGHIVRPLNDFVLQHGQARARLLETEALLGREREVAAAIRSELNALQSTSSRISGDLEFTRSELQSAKEAARDHEALITQFRLRVEDQDNQIDNLEQQIAAEVERARALSDENQLLRIDLERLDQFRLRAEGELAEAHEQGKVSFAENIRLQQLAETQAQRLVTLKAQVSELEPYIEAGRQEHLNLETRLAAEQALRQKVESIREFERSSQDGEISSLRLKVDGLTAQIGTSERMLGNFRDQLRDRSEALRASDKTVRELIAEKAAAERRSELAQEATSRQLSQMTTLQRTNSELKDRNEMLTKALSAKEALLDGSNRKSANFEGRIEQMTGRFEQERASLEATSRRLLEELQCEKAERSLAQGALDIARNSRSKLLTQYTALKRKKSGEVWRTDDVATDEAAAASVEPRDNVHHLSGIDPSE